MIEWGEVRGISAVRAISTNRSGGVPSSKVPKVVRNTSAIPSWVKLSVIALLGMGCVVTVVLLVVWSLGVPVPIYSTAPSELPSRLISAGVEAPLAEEIVYRGVICVAFVPILRRWGAILLSGALFALLHVRYGNPSPENAIGGFVLAWSYLHSGSILLPLAWHSLGNLVVVGLNVAAWFLTE